ILVTSSFITTLQRSINKCSLVSLLRGFQQHLPLTMQHPTRR
ncbi:inositol polyphosphate phosphatase, partial [Moniliophthora roreri]